MIEDAELLRRYAEDRSEPAFAELVRRRVDLVYAVARRQCGGDAHLAEEVTQRVFADLARKAKTLAGRTVISGWLYRSAQFAASDAVRSERRRRAREKEEFLMKETTTGLGGVWVGEGAAEGNMETELWRPLLDAALGELNAADRDAVALRFLEERPWAEVAGALGLKEDAARKRVARALDALQGLLARRGITSTAVALGGALGGQAAVAAPAGLAASVTAGALTATGVGTLGWGAAVFMGTTKMTVVAIGVVAVVGLGAALLGVNRVGEARVGLATATREAVELSAKLEKLEARARTERDQLQRAEDENARLLVAADRVKETMPTENETVTSGNVTARFKRAQTLILENGDPAEALREFLWCYDVGLPRISGMAGVRSVAPMLLAKLGERYPPATAVLRELQEKAKERSSNNGKDYEAVMDLGSINHALKDDAANLALYDQLPPGDTRRKALAFQSRDFLVEKQRYADAAEGWSYGEMSSSFEHTTRQNPNTPDGSNAGEYRSPSRDFIITTTAKGIEVLAGSGDLADARTLAQRLLAYDNSESTRALVQKHAERAGQPGLMEPPSNP